MTGERCLSNSTDSIVNIADAILILTVLFEPNIPPVPCENALDVNDDGSLDISDAIYGLAYLFSNGDPPPEPFPLCGEDTTPPGIPCDISTCTP